MRAFSTMNVERFLQRDRSYGIWHRQPSIRRFLGRRAASLAMLDLDSVLFAEYDYAGKLPLCLIEAAQDVGQETKPTGVIRRLAALANIPAFVALYTPSDQVNPTNPFWPDIERFRVRRLWPRPEHAWRTLTPQEWAEALVRIRGWQLKRFEVQEASNDPTY